MISTGIAFALLSALWITLAIVIHLRWRKAYTVLLRQYDEAMKLAVMNGWALVRAEKRAEEALFHSVRSRHGYVEEILASMIVECRDIAVADPVNWKSEPIMPVIVPSSRG